MLNNNQIYLGNNLDLIKNIEDNSIDLILTSPPYDNLRVYGKNSKKEVEDDLWNFDKFKLIASECSRVLKEGGVIIWVVGDATVNGSETCSSFKQAIYFKEECNLNLYDTMIYHKQNYIPLTHKRYEQSFEYMFVFSKGKPKTFNPILINTQNPGKSINRSSAKTKEQSVRGRDETTITKDFKLKDNVWTYTIGSNFIKTKHPAVFPFKLACDHILSWSNENDIILDPFAGGGTTLYTSHLLNRKYIGFEIEEKYFNEIQDKLNNIESEVLKFKKKI